MRVKGVRSVARSCCGALELAEALPATALVCGGESTPAAYQRQHRHFSPENAISPRVTVVF
jgi:hypothetical protein